MSESESCSCLDHIAEAADRRRRAAEAEDKAVSEFHRAVVDALDSPTCAHSQRQVARAAGISAGGLHNIILGAGARTREGAAP